DLDASGRVLCGQLNHPVIGQNYVRAVGDEEPSIQLNSKIAQLLDLVEKCQGIKHNAIPDHAAAVFAQHSAGDELQDELLTADNDGVPGVVSAGVTRNHGKILSKHIDNLALAFITPLRSNDNRCLSLAQICTPKKLA